MAPRQRRVVAFERLQQRRFDVAAVAALENAEIPGIVAVDAAIDQPDVDALAVGVDAEFSAAAIGLHAAAAIAVDQRLRCDCRRDRPVDTQSPDMPISPSRREVHQVGNVEMPMRARRGGRLRRCEIRCRGRKDARQRFSSAKPVSNRRPEEHMNETGTHMRRHAGVSGELTRPAVTWQSEAQNCFAAGLLACEMRPASVSVPALPKPDRLR